MVGAFFYWHNKGMDTLILFDRLMENEDLRDIPMDMIFRVVCEVVALISSGECFFKNE